MHALRERQLNNFLIFSSEFGPINKLRPNEKAIHSDKSIFLVFSLKMYHVRRR